MKRLIAAGAQAIFQIGPAFRGGELGDVHNPEFTMLEWYRVGDGLLEGMKFLAEFAEYFFDCPPCSCIPYRDAFEEVVGCDPHRATREELARRAARWRDVSSADVRDDLLELLWSHAVVPAWSQRPEPLIVFDFPETQAALAQVRRDPDGAFAERFELYFRGLELANGYHELTDPNELSDRMASTNRDRVQAGKPPMPEENRLVDALEAGFPATAGVAWGVDRAVMLATGEKKLGKVLSFDGRNA